MICPHCSRNLLRRQRTGGTCSHCHRKFALDPKDNLLGLHDIRVRRLVARLTADGAHLATTDQLRYAVHPKGRPDPEFRGSAGGSGCAAIVGTAALIGAFGVRSLLAVLLALGGIGLLALAVRLYVLTGVPAAPRPIGPRAGEDYFRTLLDAWRRTYRELPAGLVDIDQVKPVQPVGRPAAAVLCRERAVTAFLHANNVPRRHRLLLVENPHQVPDGVPVIVLHDASPQGCLLYAEVRAALPGRRVLDAGLPARAVLAAEHRFVVLRDLRRPPELQERIGRLPWLTGAELAWYAEGWWSPLAAVSPRALLATLERAAQRAAAPPPLVKQRGARTPADASAETPAETRRRAESVGFLTWPEERVA